MSKADDRVKFDQYIKMKRRENKVLENAIDILSQITKQKGVEASEVLVELLRGVLKPAQFLTSESDKLSP